MQNAQLKNLLFITITRHLFFCIYCILLDAYLFLYCFCILLLVAEAFYFFVIYLFLDF